MSIPRSYPAHKELRMRRPSSSPSSLILLVESIVYDAINRGASDIFLEMDLSPSIYKVRFMDNGRSIRMKDISQDWIRTSKRVIITSSKKERWEYLFGMPQNYEAKGSFESFLNEIEFFEFLYEHPVRQKILHPYRDVEEIRRSVFVPYSLLHYNVSFILKEERRNEVVFSINAKGSSTRRERLLDHLISNKVPCSESHIRDLKLERETFLILGLMTSLGIPKDREQYLFLNGRNIQRSKVFPLVNEIWRKHFITTSIPTYPCYLLVIKCPHNEYSLTCESKGVSVEFSRWTFLAHLLKKTLLQLISSDKIIRTESRPKVHASVFSVSGVRPLESTSSEDPRIVAQVLKRKQGPSQFQIADLHEGVRKGLPANKLRAMSHTSSSPMGHDEEQKIAEEDEVISSIRSTDFPESFGLRSQSLRNSFCTSSSSTPQSYEAMSHVKPFNDSFEVPNEFPLSSTMMQGAPSSPLLPPSLSGSSEYLSTPLDYSKMSPSFDQPIEPLTQEEETPFNFIACETNLIESREDMTPETIVDVTKLTVDVTQVSETPEEGDKEAYKEFLLKELRRIQGALKDLGEDEPDKEKEDNETVTKESKSIQTSPVSSPSLIIQSQVTRTTTLQVGTCHTINDETHATFGVIDKTLAYPETSIIKSSNIPEGWIKKPLSNGEDIFIHVDSGFTANSLEEITQKSNPVAKKSLLNAVRERGSFPPRNALTPENWNNPIMKPYNEDICPKAVQWNGSNKAIQSVENIKFDKSVFTSLQVLHQLDNKVIITLLDEDTLVLLDQHAVHERIRLERLIRENFSEYSVASTELSSPIASPLSPSMCRLLREYPSVLQRFGLGILDVTSDDVLVFSSVPTCFIHQDASRSAVPLKDIILSLCKDIHQSILEQGPCSKILPPTIRDVLNSQACRGAIKFGDPLTHEDCKGLLTDLSQCQTPFQCAHGRPSIAPIVNLKSLRMTPEFKRKYFYRVDFNQLKYNRLVK